MKKPDPVLSMPAKSFLPATAVLEMTFNCSHTCLYCSCPWEAPGSSYGREKELSANQWIKTIRKLADMGVVNFAFTGGEPTLKEGLFDIIRFAAGLKIDFTETKDGSLVTEKISPKLYLLSNGRDMNRETIEFCRQYNVHLSMSLPGLTTYQYHTGSGTQPETILHWFSEAEAAGVKTTANITVSKKNFHELFETIANALIAGADNILLNRFLIGGRGLAYRDELSLTRDELLQMALTAEEVLKQSGRYGSIGTELPYCLINQPEQFEHLKIGTRCSAAKDFFTIGPDGYIRTCNHSPVKLNHVDDIDNLKHNNYWKDFVFSRYLPEMCSGCSHLSVCDGGCREAAHIVSGSICANDPVF